MSLPELPFLFLVVVEEEAGTDEVDDSELGGEEMEADAGLRLWLFFERFLDGDFLEIGGGGGVGTDSDSLSSSELMALATELAEEQLDDELELEMGLRGCFSLLEDGRSLSDPPDDDLLLLNELFSCFPDDSLSPLELL